MNKAVRDDVDETRDNAAGSVRWRHILYVSGYDPRGARGYFELFRRTCDRFGQLWPLSLTLQPSDGEAEEFAHWRVGLRGEDWSVATEYEFLRTEKLIRADMQQPVPRQFLRALGWCLDDVASGAGFRIFRASWRFALHLLWFQVLALAWLAAAIIVGLALGKVLDAYAGWPLAVSIVVAVLAAVATMFALGPLARRWRVIQIASCWSTLRRFGRGRPTWIDHAVDRGARRLLEVARTSKADELAIVGHSTGGVIASAIVARALELDPGLGRHGPRLVLLTLGSVMPAVALHPAARRMRDIVRLLATAPALAWIDCQSRKDVMCFANFDPVDGIGVHVGGERRNPAPWRISFKQMILPEQYNRFRRNYFRVHYQYILPGDRPAPYDYVLLIAGPMPIADWPEHGDEFTAAIRSAAPPQGERSHHDVADVTP